MQEIIDTLKKHENKIKIFALLSLVLYLIENLSALDAALPQYFSFFKDIPATSRFAADFFYFIAFAERVFVSAQPYYDSMPLLMKYFDVDFEGYRFVYPPNIIIFIGHLYPIKKFFGMNAAISSVFIINLLLTIPITLILKKITGFSGKILWLVWVANVFSSVLISSGQLSYFFALSLVSAIYFYLKDQKVLAGIFLSVFAFKPQIALLLGLFVISNKRLFVGAVLGVISSTLITLFLCGLGVYRDYYKSFFENFNKSTLILHERAKTLPALLHNNFHLDTNLIVIIQALLIIASIIFTVFIFKKDKNLNIESKLGLMILLNFLVCPYLLIYDLVISAIGIILLAKQYSKDYIFMILAFLYLFLRSASFIDFMTNSIHYLFLLFVILYIISTKTSVLKSGFKFKNESSKQT